MLPLDDLVVVTFEQAVAAPFATRQLADLGARVIKIERPGAGDFARHYDHTVGGDSSYFVWLNRGKESAELDFKDAADRAVIDAMLARADVVVHNLVPGAVERAGLDAETLRSQRPELIHCSISGYGRPGPYSGRKAYDLLVQCEAGMVEATGSPEAGARVGASIADIATGMYAYTGILSAVVQRLRSGVGSTLEVTMLEALAEWMSQPMYWSRGADVEWPRSGARHATIAPYGPFHTADHAVFLCVQSDREWGVVCREVLARPDLVDHPRFAKAAARATHADEVCAEVEACFVDRTSAEVLAALDTAGIANGTVRTPREVADHPQLTARQRWREVSTPAGSMQALLPPVTVQGSELVMGEVPPLGAHTEALRAEFLGGSAS